MRFGRFFLRSILSEEVMRILWHLYLLIGLVVAAGAEPINNVPGCEDAPTASKETSTSTTTSTQATPSTGTTETETSTSTPTSTTATPSIGTTETESPTMRTTETETTPRTTTTTKGAREKDEPKYGYYTDYYGCFYKVLKSRGLLYHANCLYYCPWKPHVYRVRDGVTCLTILEKGAQERAYRDSKVCRKGRCFNGLCIPTGYVQGCTVPNTFPRNLPRNTLDHSE
uniref:Evasin n=1 Tax=Rhipicephalus microplus TaxID=6941 RepID=A0A6G5A6X2_RHIMP